MARPVLILFARAPRLGCVKRRLAREIGDVAALRFYRTLLARLLRRFSALRGWDLWLAVTPDGGFVRVPVGWGVMGQGRGDLGVRMHRAFARFPRRRVVLVGSDIPALRVGDVRGAARGLRRWDAVFGPAVDGGYYLVAMAGRRPARPFAWVRWSSADALADTLRNFERFRVGFGRVLRDVDSTADFSNPAP